MSANKKFTNDLSKETSPYLLQHAHNPVQWKPWSETLFSTATAADKPILLSIGYAACHWCHVMERESFEDEAVADYMNTHFINIKVDREERPDIDHIYMDALQAMTGSGGWPLNIFLLPNGQPFYGGTYFPPNAMQNRASWMDVLKGVHAAFESNREKLVEQATHLTAHLLQSNIKAQQSQASEVIATTEEFQMIAQRILQNADTQWGGFGAAPKFPQTFSIQVLFRNYFQNKDQGSIVHAIRSIDKMIQGGIYDHVGGGFSRYSVDAMWQAPHFEKMLYDNALILGT
ncbi:MAG: thioredoxin domain-containing protein, partial [Sediminibacterium sp.]